MYKPFKAIMAIWLSALQLFTTPTVNAQEIAPGPDPGNPWDEPIDLLPPLERRLWEIERTLLAISQEKIVEFCFTDLGTCGLTKVRANMEPVSIGIDGPIGSADSSISRSWIPRAEYNEMRRKNQIVTFNTTLAELRDNMSRIDEQLTKLQDEKAELETDLIIDALQCTAGAISCAAIAMTTAGVGALLGGCSLSAITCLPMLNSANKLTKKQKEIREKLKQQGDALFGSPAGPPRPQNPLEPEPGPITWELSGGLNTGRCPTKTKCSMKGNVLTCIPVRDC